jgi:hypothetical protein
MVSSLGELELQCIDELTRPELLAAIRASQAHLPVDLLERLEEQSTHRLQLLLLAARLIHVLRQVKSCN